MNAVQPQATQNVLDEISCEDSAICESRNYFPRTYSTLLTLLPGYGTSIFSGKSLRRMSTFPNLYEISQFEENRVNPLDFVTEMKLVGL
jgi:hypothetical protein